MTPQEQMMQAMLGPLAGMKLDFLTVFIGMLGIFMLMVAFDYLKNILNEKYVRNNLDSIKKYEDLEDSAADSHWQRYYRAKQNQSMNRAVRGMWK